MVGGRVEQLAPQYCRPGELAIANHQTRHEVNNELSHRLDASDEGTQIPKTTNRPERYLKEPVLGTVPSTGSWVGALFFLSCTQTEQH